MTKLEAWKAWNETVGVGAEATEFALEKSSHGKAFSYAWDAAVAENERLREALHDISISKNSMYQESRAKQALGEDQKIWRMCGVNTDDVIKMAEEAGIVMSLTDERVTLNKLNRFLELHLKALKNEGYRRGET